MFPLTIHFFIMGIWIFFGLRPTIRWCDNLYSFVRNSLGIGGDSAKLESDLRNIIFNLNSNEKLKITSYKFYDKLVWMLTEHKFQMGIDITCALQELMHSLGIERKFVKKNRIQFESSMAQFFIVAAMTWIFNFFIGYLLEIKLRSSDLRIIGFFQVSGIISFFLCFYLSYQKKFKNYAGMFELFYVCRSLWSANFPINQISQKLGQISIVKENKFNLHLKKYEQLIELGQSFGTVEDKDFNSLIEGLWESQELDFEQFAKALIVLKFLHLLLFFVSSYFLLLYFLLERLQF